MGMLLSPRGDKKWWEVKAVLRASHREGVWRGDGHSEHQILVLNTPESLVGFACSAPSSSPHLCTQSRAHRSPEHHQLLPIPHRQKTDSHTR